MPHPVCGHCGGVVAARDSLAQALIINEKEQLVFQDRPAERASKLVAVIRGSCAVIEEVAGIQRSIAVEFEGAAVKAVRSRLQRGHQDCATGPAIFGGCHARLHAEFVDSVRRRKEHNGIHQGFVVVDAI